MVYLGSKTRIARFILPILMANKPEGGYYIEPFVGGANIIDKITGARIGADINPYLIAMYQALQNGWWPKAHYTKDEYEVIKANPDADKALSGYVSTQCTFSNIVWGPYVGGRQWCESKGVYRDYQLENWKSLMRQVPFLKGIEFTCAPYYDLELPTQSLIYCDPPYSDSLDYKTDFDSERFWQWCRDKSAEGHTVFISEYKAPDDFTCVLEVPKQNQVNNKINIERLFAYSKGHYKYLPKPINEASIDLFAL